jgi:hypothetical protein
MDDDAPSAPGPAMQTAQLKISPTAGIDELFARLIGPEVYAPSTTLLDAKPPHEDSGIEDYLDSLAADAELDAQPGSRSVSGFVSAQVNSAKKNLEHLFSLLLG